MQSVRKNILILTRKYSNDKGRNSKFYRSKNRRSKAGRCCTVEAFMDEIRTSLAANKENVYLRGFGSFIVKHRAKKTARNISKNTTLVIEAHDLPAFKPCKSFIEKMGESK